MKEIISGVLIALLGSGLIQFLITRADKKKENPLEKKLDEFMTEQSGKLNKIIDEQKKTEKDQLRTQLLVMMTLMPNSHEEIMQLAERYFSKLNGDWFYSSLFAKWLKANDIEKPLWFTKGE